MSISGGSDIDRLYNKSTHRRKDSGKLDVFEATMYFYGGTQVGGGLDRGASSTSLPQKTISEELRQVSGGRRMSLDLSMRHINPIPPLQSQRVDQKQIKDKKYKQPMSPGGRLTSFLNSLFNQKSSKKKKSQSVKDHHYHHEEETSTEGMRRRSSVSHFGSLWMSDSNSLRSSSSSGFRTPPHAKKQTKAHKDLRRNSTEYRNVASLSNNNRKHQVIHTTTLASSEDEVSDTGKKKKMDLAWLDEKLKLIDELSENKNIKSSCNGQLFKKDMIWVDEDEDDGDQSDSSSDLFELQNYDLCLYSNGLPVYETTHIESIKSGPPISNGPCF